MMRRKKKVTSDFKIKMFVSFLFLIIVFLIGYAYIMYHQIVLTRMYFDTVKFNKDDRSIQIFNRRSQESIRGMLGSYVVLKCENLTLTKIKILLAQAGISME